MKQFSNIAKFLHWSVAGLIVSQYVLAKLAENAKHENQILEQLALLANHKSVGITILVLAVIRLLYRFKVPTPGSPPSTPHWQLIVSKASHSLLYGFLFLLPISGWLMSSAKSYSVSWFNVIALPDFVAPNESLAENLHTIHYYLAEALFVIAVIHILAALKHHFIDKDDVLVRISSRFSWALFVLVLVFVIGFFGRLFDVSPVTISDPLGSVDVTKAAVALPPSKQGRQSDLPLWDIDYSQSYIKFTGDQAGAPFEGEWQKWSAEIQFDETQFGMSRFSVAVDPSSGFSNDKDRDDTIRSADFFDVESFPEVVYYVDTFSSKGAEFEGLGTLSMKGVVADVALSFSITESATSKILKGTASLDRFNWNIGSGDWVDTDWVGQNVKVEVRVVAKP